MIVSSITGTIIFNKLSLVTQANAVKANTIATNFSSYEILPSFFNCFNISALPPGKAFCLKLNAKLVKYFQHKNNSIIEIGRPNLNH